MEPRFYRYIWKHTSRQQIWILSVVLISMVPYYFAFDLPKMLINGPITGGGFESPGATQPFLPGTIFAGPDLDRMQTLLALSLAFLTLVMVNGLFKYYINTYKGLLGERLLRRVRFELIDRLLRFLPGEFKRIKGGEVASMVKDEVEPLGGFTSEAFVQPLLLGGQALTALAFIFVQNVWLGLLALFMASVQILVIPRLRRQLLILGRQRQLAARQLAGKVTEIVEGIETIHAYDTSNYERADVANRLGNLFRIRFEIYTRKFKIKFLNNFLAQLTPFLFYLIGGYLAISGRLDVGQLVAVINAYKELPGPLKELIDWDMARQDVQVKYEQVVEQFDAEQMIHPDAQMIDANASGQLGHPLSASNITMQDEGGSTTLEHVSVTIESGETVAVVGDVYSGADVLAEAFGGIARPVKGRITAGKENLLDLPESVTGQRISYASSNTFFFSGSLRDNLLYGLKHRPLNEVSYKGDDATRRQWETVEARRTGNPVHDLNSDWIDTGTISGLTDGVDLVDAMRQVLRVVQLSDDVFDFALHSRIDAQRDKELANRIVKLRQDVQTTLRQHGRSELIIPFDMNQYNEQASVLENIVFGVLTRSPGDKDNEDGIAYFRSILRQTGLDEQLFRMGLSIVESSRELFEDLPEDDPVFDRMEMIGPTDIPRLMNMYQRNSEMDFEKIAVDDLYEWINLSFLYVEPQYRFGLLNKELMQKIIDTRKRLHAQMPDRIRDGIDMYDPERFLPSANLLDNIVFGKVNRRLKNVGDQLRDAVAPIFDRQPDLYNQIYAVGLEYNVGPAGRRLTNAQRQKLNLARAVMRKSDYYIFNRPVSGLDESQQARIISNTLKFFEERKVSPGIVWVLASKQNARYFQRCITFRDKMVFVDKRRDDDSLESAEKTPDTV